LVGSIVPGIGTLAGALGGIIYDVVERNSEEAPPKEEEKKEQ
jgi:hypothetical protein